MLKGTKLPAWCSAVLRRYMRAMTLVVGIVLVCVERPGPAKRNVAFTSLRLHGRCRQDLQRRQFAFTLPKDHCKLMKPQLTQIRNAVALQAAGDTDSSRSRPVQVWGVSGVIAYLSYGVFRVVPIVQEGLSSIEEPWQWGLLLVTLLFFAYVEGYRGFQLGFSPRVISRAWVVSEESASVPLWHKILAPAFCIGYFHGTFRRVAASWGVTTVIFLVVVGVKQLANPYRAIIDAGVIVGLMWGIISIVLIFLGSFQNDKPPDFDPALPDDTPYTAP